MDQRFWFGKRVFITGHTGFKGAWLCLLLRRLGADIIGYSLNPTGENNLFNIANVSTSLTKDHRNNVLDYDNLLTCLQESKADIVIHMAAQALVSKGYQEPVATFETNVMGTVNILNAIRFTKSVKAALIITTDKCYENTEKNEGYVEEDRLGGHDPYSNSKACAELVTSAYQTSYFSETASCNIATARAGNVIGGGDWSTDRIIPDCIRAFSENKTVDLRAPQSIRPWQHVLDPLSGYLLLSEKLFNSENYQGAWNFGPRFDDELTVKELVQYVSNLWFKQTTLIDKTNSNNKSNSFHETTTLRLNSSKAMRELNFKPGWDINETIEKTVSWYKRLAQHETAEIITKSQIEDYLF